jgi:hypothetical protein
MKWVAAQKSRGQGSADDAAPRAGGTDRPR